MNEKTVFDPLRKKDVALTPEEGVRQWFIAVLRDEFKVPMTMMMSEVGMKYGQVAGGIKGTKQKTFRADILVYDRSLNPLMIVECKRPEVPISVEVLEQAAKYATILNVKYLVVTNGSNSYFARKTDEGMEFTSDVPDYETMNK